MKHILMVLFGTGAACWLLVTLSGCGATRGWDFHIGVNPVSEVKDQKNLRYEDGTIEKAH